MAYTVLFFKIFKIKLPLDMSENVFLCAAVILGGVVVVSHM